MSATKMDRAPLVHVLAQVRFTPVLTISRSIPDIQEGLKGVGFPRFQKSEVQNIVLHSGAPPTIDNLERWDFLSRDRRSGVVVTQGFVVLHTSAYDTFLEFSRMLRDVLEVFASYVQVSVVDRLGIRYVDLIRLEKGEKFTDYLKPGLVGFPVSDIEDADIARAQTATRAILQTSEGSKLVVQSSQVQGGAFLPPDLSPTVLQYDVRLRADESVTILDFDHYKEVDEDYSTDSVISQLDALHRVANAAFRATLLPFAYRKWGGTVR